MTSSLTRSRFVILGNGAAALAALKKIHELQPDLQIDLFTIEDSMAYFPSALGHLLKSEKLENFFYLTNLEFYRRLGATLHQKASILEVDLEKQRIKVEGKPSISYDKLLIATGVSPSVLAPSTPLITTIKELKQWNSFLSAGKRIALVGDDLETLSWTSHLVQFTSSEVLYFSPETSFLPSLLDLDSSKFLEKAFLKLGGRLHLKKTIIEQRKILGQNEIELISDFEEKWLVDLVFKTDSWLPNLPFLPGFMGWIPVNERMETPWPGVYAAGSVTKFKGQPTSRLYGIASQQGEIAGQNMAGEEGRFSFFIPYNCSEWFQVKMGWFGDFKGSDEVIEEREEGFLRRIYLQRGRIIGALMIGDCQSLEIFYALAKNRRWSAKWSEQYRENPKAFFRSQFWLDRT